MHFLWGTIHAVQAVLCTEYIKGQRRNRESVSALSAGAHTTTLYVMVDIMNGGGH